MELSPEAIDNQGLFSDYYLENVFRDRPDAEDVFERADDALEQAREIYDEEKQGLVRTKEGQTEEQFIRPIMEDVLGWDFIVGETVQGQQSFGEPDYALFSTSETYRNASGEASKGNRKHVFRQATALAEAKKWRLSLDGTETPAIGNGAPSQGTPGAQLLRYFQWTDVSWGILTNGNKWRLYTDRVPSPVDTYLEFDLEHILEQPHGTSGDPTDAQTAFRLFYALSRARAFREDPTLGQPFIESVFEESVEKGEELEDELTERVFDEVFIDLATGLYEDWREEDMERPPDEVLDEIYNATLRLLYRLLFLLYAEERDLLPVRDPKGYYQYSLTRIAKEARKEVRENHVLVGDDLWGDLTFLFAEIINSGEPSLNVPTYNGNLFDVGNEENAWLDRHTVPDAYLAPALMNLTLMDPDDPDSRGVDYKALDVRQLGSIYEGLLEHQLQYADEDKAIVKENGTEVYKSLTKVKNPAEVVEEGELYLETDEEERKKTGSYYTPHYIVEYIVENTLGPIVDERIEQFEEAMAEIDEIMEEAGPTDRGVGGKLDAPRRRAREALLSLRVCDPAMGSGHFLVHAVDYITNRIGAVALERDWTVNPIREELDDIRSDILDSLDEQDVQIHDPEDRLDDFTLLKRLVMKRCIYGVDLNEMAVELAKLSLWLRSFTVGAPLSFLDHHLKAGNSLIGTAVDTVVDEIQADLFGNVRDEILRGTRFLQDAAFNTDATLTDVKASAEAFRTYQDTMRPYKRLLDLWTAQHFGVENTKDLVFQSAREVIMAYQDGEEASLKAEHDAVARTDQLRKENRLFHWELEFPEVFYELDPPGDRDNPGFDAVIGNPPYGYRVTGDIDDYLEEVFGKAESENVAEYFVEKCFGILKQSSDWGMIIPKQVLHTPTWSDVRKTIHGDSTSARTIVDVSEAFSEVLLEQVVVLASAKETDRVKIGRIKNGGIDDSYSIASQKLTDQLWPIYAFDEFEEIYERIDSVSDPLGSLSDLYFGIKNIKSKLTQSTGVPMITGDNISRYEVVGDPPCLPKGEIREKWEKKYLIPKLVVQRIVAHVTKPHPHIIVMASNDKEGRLAFDTATVVRSNDEDYSDDFLLAIINSRYTSWYLHRFVYNFSTRTMGFRDGFADKLPIRDIDFTTPANERAQHIETAVAAYEDDRAAGADPADSATLGHVDTHLDAAPEQADVVHDLLAQCAREMADLKAERQTYNLDLTNWITAPSDDEGVGLRDIGRYQPADGVTDTVLADKTDERAKLHIHHLFAETDATDGSYMVRVRAVARFKPEVERSSWPDTVPEEAERDRNGYVMTKPTDVCVLYECDEIEAGLAVHWLEALDNRGEGYSGYRDNATSRDYSLLNRVSNARFPNPSDKSVRDALRPFLDSVQQANELDRQIRFTDGLIDQIVYRLYGLTDEEIAVVES
jgi:type I restriction-modification system DNA methylase subunit